MEESELKRAVLKRHNEAKNILLKNIGKKILAVAIAIVLWFVANIEHDIEKSVSVNVNYINLPSDLIIVNNPPERLNVRVRGPRTQLSSLSSRNIVFSLDLSNASPGLSKFEIQMDQIKTPRGVQVTGITPAEIRIDIDRLMRREVDVQPVIVGPVDTGYEVVGVPTVIPSKVEIRGPKNTVSKIDTIPTDLVSIVGVRSKFTIQVPLRSPSPLIDIVGDKMVKVTVDIREQMVEKQFKNMDIRFVNFDKRDFEPVGLTKAELVFEGPYSVIKDLSSDDINVFVDGSNLDNNTGKLVRLQVDVTYPHKDVITLKKKVPMSIEVRLN